MVGRGRGGADVGFETVLLGCASYEKGFDACGAGPCWSIAPQDGVAGYEVGECAGEEDQATEDAEDVEDGGPAGSWLGGPWGRVDNYGCWYIGGGRLRGFAGAQIGCTHCGFVDSRAGACLVRR